MLDRIPFLMLQMGHPKACSETSQISFCLSTFLSRSRCLQLSYPTFTKFVSRLAVVVF
jgi:hypothetical protein